MRSAVAFFVVLLVSVWAGCIDDGDEVPSERNGEPEPPMDPDWPAIDDAVLRPGAPLFSEGLTLTSTGGCTVGFVFQSPDNATIYVTTAAHCLDDEEVGASLELAEGRAEGTFVYSSFATLKELGEYAYPQNFYNDFAIIEIHEASRHLVHPAMVHFGGPAAIADPDRVEEGDRVLTYGISWVRQGVHQTNQREGYVVMDPTVHHPGWHTSMYQVAPATWGDSGSAIITAQGEALCIQTHLHAPGLATTGCTNLVPALAFAKEHAGIEMGLSTWHILDRGLLPDLP